MTSSPSNARNRRTGTAVHLDAEALARLRALDPQGGLGLLQKVAASFATSIDRLLPQLRAATAAGDVRAVQFVAHTLKSSAASIGALDLSRTCAAVEAQARAGNTVAGLDAAVAILCTQAQAALTALQALPEVTGP